ncbi:MAG TPA: helix-turn-helix transcriptional regulator [Terriglobia bacterium]|nr:helix-turn-helix transcriptional regulator [Terriglobia bacterium]
MATSRMSFQTLELFGAPDGLTNTHVRKQIRRLRLSKGWTKHDLEEAARLAPDTLEDFEAGIRCITVDTLRKLIEALESDITEVWPSADGSEKVRNTPLPGQADETLHLSRLAEIHSLTGAEVSCMFVGNTLPSQAVTAADGTPGHGLQLLSSINLAKDENEWLCQNLRQGNVASPWTVYICRENGRSLYLCLKNARVEFWAEGFIQSCLYTWLASTPF